MQVYDNAGYIGVDDIDRKLIFMAIQNGEKLTIDRYGHVYDSSKRWIADAMKRQRNCELQVEIAKMICYNQ